MNIDIDSIVKNMDLEKLVEENITSNIMDYVDVSDIVDNVLEDEKLKAIIETRVADIIVGYLSSDEGKKCVIEKFGEFVVDSDMMVDDRITDVIIDFLKTTLTARL